MSKDTFEEYRETVDSIAAEALEADEPSDYIHESCDGSYWVIYTHAARSTLTHSQNWLAIDEYADDVGEMAWPDGGLCAVLSLAAYHALRADVEERLSELQAEQDDEVA